jgi:hypothetical protein
MLKRSSIDANGYSGLPMVTVRSDATPVCPRVNAPTRREIVLSGLLGTVASLASPAIASPQAVDIPTFESGRYQFTIIRPQRELRSIWIRAVISHIRTAPIAATRRLRFTGYPLPISSQAPDGSSATCRAPQMGPRLLPTTSSNTSATCEATWRVQGAAAFSSRCAGFFSIEPAFFVSPPFRCSERTTARTSRFAASNGD